MSEDLQGMSALLLDRLDHLDPPETLVKMDCLDKMASQETKEMPEIKDQLEDLEEMVRMAYEDPKVTQVRLELPDHRDGPEEMELQDHQVFLVLKLKVKRYLDPLVPQEMMVTLDLQDNLVLRVSEVSEGILGHVVRMENPVSVDLQDYLVKMDQLDLQEQPDLQARRVHLVQADPLVHLVCKEHQDWLDKPDLKDHQA